MGLVCLVGPVQFVRIGLVNLLAAPVYLLLASAEWLHRRPQMSLGVHCCLQKALLKHHICCHARPLQTPWEGCLLQTHSPMKVDWNTYPQFLPVKC